MRALAVTRSPANVRTKNIRPKKLRQIGTQANPTNKFSSLMNLKRWFPDWQKTQFTNKAHSHHNQKQLSPTYMHHPSGNTRHSFVTGLRKGPALDELSYSCPDIPRQYEPFSTCCEVCVRRIATPHRSLWSSFPTSSTFGVLAKSAGIPESIGSKIGRLGSGFVANDVGHNCLHAWRLHKPSLVFSRRGANDLELKVRSMLDQR